jgi:hypothetical protein
MERSKQILSCPSCYLQQIPNDHLVRQGLSPTKAANKVGIGGRNGRFERPRSLYYHGKMLLHGTSILLLNSIRPNSWLIIVAVGFLMRKTARPSDYSEGSFGSNENPSIWYSVNIPIFSCNVNVRDEGTVTITSQSVWSDSPNNVEYRWSHWHLGFLITGEINQFDRNVKSARYIAQSKILKWQRALEYMAE